MLRALTLWGLFLAIIALFWLEVVPRLHHEAEAKCLTAQGSAAEAYCSYLISTGWHKSPEGLIRQARGLSAFNQRDYRQALGDFRAAKELEFRLAVTEFWLGRTLYERKRYEESVDAFTHALDAGDGQRSLIWRGWAAMHFDYAQAVADFDAVQSGPEYDHFKQWVHRGRGEMRIRLADYDAAIEDLLIARELEPENYRVVGNLSWAAREKGDFETALEWADLALEMSPAYRWAHQLRGHALFMLGRYNEALEEFDWLIEQDFRRGIHMMRRAEALTRLGRHQAAIDTLIARQYAGWWDLQLFVGLIRAHCALGQNEDAVGYAQSALRRYPDFAWLRPDISNDPTQVCQDRVE